MRRLLIALSLLAIAAAPPPKGATTGEHRVRTTDGTELWYRVAGVERGTPILFLHGGPGEGSQAMQAYGGPELEKRVRMVYLDQRGSGRSDRPKDKKFYSLALLESDVDDVRRNLGADKVILLAHSAGTLIALNYAAEHPEHVAGVILTGAVPDIPAASDALCDRIKRLYPALYPKAASEAPAGQKCDPFSFGSNEVRQRFFDDNMFPNEQVKDRVNWIDAIPGVANDGSLGSPLFEQGVAKYRFDRPERLTMPVLFIAGSRDFQTAVAPQQALARKLRDGRVIMLPGAGHFTFADKPIEFATDVAAFVTKVSR